MHKHDTVTHSIIHIFAPSGPLRDETVLQGLEIIKKESPDTAEALRPLPHTRKPAPPFQWLYDSDSEQAAAFSMLMDINDAAFVWAMRGGYGILRWLPMVQWDVLSEKCPLVTGFSDLTALHAALNSRGIKSIHGPMICTLPATRTDSKMALWECFTTGKLPELHGTEVISGKGMVHGRAIGGNLCTLTNLLGTPWEPPWDNNILFIEDHNETLYRIDRMLTHLLAAGRLSRLSGIAAGEFSNTGDTDPMLKDLLADRLGNIGAPVITGISTGHGENNLPILLGGKYLLDTGACMLTPLERAGRRITGV